MQWALLYTSFAITRHWQNFRCDCPIQRQIKKKKNKRPWNENFWIPAKIYQRCIHECSFWWWMLQMPKFACYYYCLNLIDPTKQVLKKLWTYLEKKQVEGSLPTIKESEKFMEIPRVSGSKLSVRDFIQKFGILLFELSSTFSKNSSFTMYTGFACSYAVPKRPVIITDLNLTRVDWSLPYIKEKCGQEHVELQRKNPESTNWGRLVALEHCPIDCNCTYYVYTSG